MADAAPKTPKTLINSSSSSPHENPPSKYFLYKAALVTVFLVLVPLFPSLAPDFINQTLHARSWELLQLIFVGIAVSYGLFSKKNDDLHKDNHTSKIDNAQSYVSKLLQVSSVFDDESENHATVVEENKFQALNSQYYRGEVPVVVKENPSVVGEGNAVVSHQISQKPLLLPVRSLKQRVPGPSEADLVVDEPGRASSKRGSSSSSRKSRIECVGGLNVDKMEEKVEENVVLRSPIPWRSRSGRLVMKEGGDEGIGKEEQELNRVESRSFKPSRPNESLLSESQSKGSDDVVIRKKNMLSSPPPAPPPPPPPPFPKKSMLTKSTSCVANNAGSGEKVLRWQSMRNVPTEELSEDDNVLLKSVRTFRPYENELDQNKKEEEEKKTKTKTELVETTDEEESEAESEEYDHFEGGSLGNVEAAADDVGPDVDKKADEFIAKFREQIRLQRIESIRRSTAQRSAGKKMR